MKQLLLIFALFCASHITMNAQTKTWIGASGGSFNMAANWSPAGIPTTVNDVIIPTGSNIIIESADIKSIAIQGNATARLSGFFTFSNASSIGTNATFVSNGGFFLGSGTLTNNGTVSITGNNSTSIGGTVILLNNGTINFDSTSPLVLGYGNGTITNATSGVINLNSDTSISFSQGVGSLINTGLINKNQSSGLFSINSIFQNNNGTISVQSGTLRINNSNAMLTNGIYNVTSGNTLEWASTFTLLGTLTGQLDGQINWTGNMSVAPATEAVLDFSGSTGVNWTTGFLGGDGTLTNMGILNLVSMNNKSVSGQSILNNEGIINYNGSGSLLLGYGNGSLTNAPSGVINLNSDSSVSFSQGSGTLINTGLISRNQGSGLFSIDSKFENNNGTISVQSGTLRINNSNALLTNGIYNVTSGNTLEWASTFTLSGTLTGQLDGQINWTGNMTVATGTEAILDFNGPTGVNWTTGFLGGDGTLTNLGILNLVSENSKAISGQSILKNEGIVNFDSTGSLVLGYGNGTLNNATSGVINLNSDSSISFSQGVGSLINTGIIEKDQSTGTFSIAANTNNMSPGSIICENGLLVFGNYVGDGLIGGNGSVQMQNSTLFEGTIAPGSSPGILTYVGNYNSSSNAILAIEINGPNSGTQYDVFAIQGNAAMNGIVEITMGYDANINDEFVVATTTGTISQCNLAPTTSADFNGMTYTFDVFCRNNKQVVLGVNNIALGVNDFELSESSIQLYPNPVQNILTIKNMNNLELDNAQVMDITGKVITTLDLKNMGLTKDISLENFSSGMYFVKITGLNSSVTKRIIKQ